MTLKNRLIKRFTPTALRETLRFIYLKELLFGSSADRDMASLVFSRRVMLKQMLDAYRFPSMAIWNTLFVPPEILYAMNLRPFCLEIGASIFSKIGQSQSALLEAEAHGVPTDGCSFHRAAIGYVYRNFYPHANHIATTTSLCDSNPKTVNICQAITGVSSTVLDVPYDTDNDSVNFLAEQLEGLTADLERSFGVVMDMDALKRRIECTNRTREKMVEVNRLRMDPDSPLSGSRALGLIVNSHLLCGSDDGEEFYDMLIQDVKDGIKAAKGKVRPEANDKVKILWLELKPYFENDLLSNMEEKLGVKIVFEEISYVYWDALDPDKPYESLARRLITNQNNGPLENRLKVIDMLVRQYNVDGVIMFASWGCRRNAAAVPAIKAALQEKGVPSLVLHGDCVDDSTYTEGQFSTRIEGFLEMLRGGVNP